MPAFALESRLDGAVGGKTATALEKAFGMRTVGDLLAHYPRRYAKRGELTPISSLPLGEPVTIVAEVRRASERRMQNRKGSLLEVVISDGQGELSLTFFNQSWRLKDLQPGSPRSVRRQGGGVPRREAARPPRLRAVRR